MASLPMLSSALTDQETADLIESCITDDTPRSLIAIEEFQEFTSTYVTEITVPPMTPWMSAAQIANLQLNRLTITERWNTLSAECKILLNSLLLLSWKVKNISTLSHLSNNGNDALNCLHQFTSLAPIEKLLVKEYLKALMTFWIAYDQLDATDDTRVRSRRALHNSLVSGTTRNPRVYNWFISWASDW